MNAAVELPAPTPPVTGLLLTGGGARAAYQVGVLEAVMRIARECRAPHHNPFQVITGTSAGAINAAALACRSDDFAEAVAEIADLWRNVHAEQVYRADSLSMIRSGAPWLTQYWSRQEVEKVYSDLSPQLGYSGDEDQGLMGSLAVLMKTGLFSVNGGTSEKPFYEIGSPIFNKITLHLNPKFYPGGKFVIEAKNNLLPKIDLNIPNANFTIKKAANVGFSIIAKSELTPLVQLKEVDT